MPLDSLPIDSLLPELVEHLRSHGAVVLKAEPGAGKTTRVPPAVLDGGLTTLVDGSVGQIIVLQPRRVAARAAALRISDERGTTIGAEIGYQVRHEGRSSKNTRILVCTEGIFLRKLQDDPLIENVAAVIFDEFHERSLDSDLALAMTRLVRQVRSDLRIVVMSATLESAPIGRYLGDCPIVESPGRTFPIEIEYLQFPTSAPVDEVAEDGIRQMLPKTNGHILTFLPGIGEIRQTAANLEGWAEEKDVAVLPLYGELSLEEQQAVLKPSPRRKIILSTNIAETSLTIDGVMAVVDTGLARINRFDPQVGLNRLELSKISKASATQRAGRAGRTAPGKCLRLWTQRDHMSLAEFELPEIARVDLCETVLRLLAWGENDIVNFSWFEPPPASAVENALALIDKLDAIADGKITELGKRMIGLPLQPRLARLAIEGEHLGVPRAAALCAALLSERSPFRRQTGELRKVQHHSHSDLMDRVHSLQQFSSSGTRATIAGELITGPAKQVLRVSDQLARELAISDYDEPADEESLLRAIAAAFPDRVCKRRQTNNTKSNDDIRAVMVGGRGVKLADESAVRDCDLFVAVEVADIGRAELIVRQASVVKREWLPESQITSAIDIEYDAEREKVVAFKRTKFCDLVLDESVTSLPPDADCGAILAAAVAARMDVDSLVDDSDKQYLARVQSLREWLPELALPDLGANPWTTLLPDWCYGCSSVAELKSRSARQAIQSRLTHQQIVDIDREAPERFTLPNGRTVKLEYEAGKPPVLAARIQDLFGVQESPRIARGRVSLIIHLLAPNYRVQQITPDLAGFWKNTYADVRKELRGRYPKHKWPENPLAPI